MYSGRVVSLNLERVQLPDGHCMDMEIIHHAGGSATVAIDEQQRVCLIHQYRYAVDDWIWEIPAGLIDAGDTPDSTASKELQQEAGIQAADWTPLGKMLATPGCSNEITYLYLARTLQPAPVQREPGEIMEVHWIPMNEAMTWAREGKINDAKTLVALYRAHSLLQD